MTGETWRPFWGFEDRYEISDLARVRSATTGKILSQPLRNGYRVVFLWRDGYRTSANVHRVLLATFGRPPVGEEVARHLNGDRLDNRLENLAWGSKADNTQDMIEHGRHAGIRMTHCRRGHPFDEANTRLRVSKVGPRPYRVCLACERAGRPSLEARRQRRRAARSSVCSLGHPMVERSDGRNYCPPCHAEARRKSADTPGPVR